MKEAVIIDYGSGNISSVYNAVKKVSLDKSCKVKVTSLARDLKKASHIILPGVGSFESCVTGLEKSGIKEQLIESVIEKKTPFLGICVGMQMLATKGYENGEFFGLNWVKGEVRKINTHKQKLKIPHMGWNSLKFLKYNSFVKKLINKINTGNCDEINAYFVHSYNFKLKYPSEKILTTNYGEEITAMISKENIIGTQFHPEKSHYFGLAFLQTFIENGEFE